MSDSNRVLLSFFDETTYGVVPTAAAYQAIRYTGESLTQDTDTVVSQEIRADRETADLIRTGISNSGSIDFEVSYDPGILAFNELLRRALMSVAWTAASFTVTTSLAADSTTSTYTGSAGEFTGLTVGDVVTVAGFDTNDSNNGVALVTAIDGPAAVITVDKVLITEAGSGDETVTATSYIEAGTLLESFTILKEYEDLSTTYKTLAGNAIDTMSISVPADGVATGSFGIIGKVGAVTATNPSSGTTAVTTGAVMNGIDDVDNININGIVSDATSISLELTNNLRSRLQLSTLGPISLGSGQIGLSGTIQGYFEDTTEMADYLAFAETSLLFSLGLSSVGEYYFNIPRIKFTSGSAVAGGINTDVIADMGWTAYLHDTLGFSFRIHKST